jgi:hypothetical protein
MWLHHELKKKCTCRNILFDPSKGITSYFLLDFRITSRFELLECLLYRMSLILEIFLIKDTFDPLLSTDSLAVQQFLVQILNVP